MGLEVVALLEGSGPVRGPHLGLEPLAERLAEAARPEVAAAELSGTQADHLAMIWVEAIEAVEAHLCSILI